jgi:hypothetical protein
MSKAKQDQEAFKTVAKLAGGGTIAGAYGLYAVKR